MPEDEGYEDFEVTSSEPDEENSFIEENKISIIFALLGLISVGLGIFFYKDNQSVVSNDIEIIDAAVEELTGQNLIVEITGAVNNPGVYEIEDGARINDLIKKAGGLQDNADGEFLDKIINRAAKLTDSQKIYIPYANEHSNTTSANSSTGGAGTSISNGQNILGAEDTQTKRVNVNTASKSELESLWGIGPVTAQSIIEQRPYSAVEELLTKKILKRNVFERNENLLSVY